MAKQKIYKDFFVVYNTIVSADPETMKMIVFLTNLTNIDFSDLSFNIKFVKVKKIKDNALSFEKADEIKMHMPEIPFIKGEEEVKSFVAKMNSLMLNCREIVDKNKVDFIDQLDINFCGIPCFSLNIDKSILVFADDRIDKIIEKKKKLLEEVKNNSNFDIVDLTTKASDIITNGNFEELKESSFKNIENLVFSINNYLGFLRSIVEKRNFALYPELFVLLYNKIMTKNVNVTIHNLYTLVKKHISSPESRIAFFNNNLLDGTLYYRAMLVNKQKAINFLDRIGDVIIACNFIDFENDPLSYLESLGLEVENTDNIYFESQRQNSMKINKFINNVCKNSFKNSDYIDKEILEVFLDIIQKNRKYSIYSSIQRGFIYVIEDEKQFDSKNYLEFFLGRFFSKYSSFKLDFDDAEKSKDLIEKLRKFADFLKQIPSLKGLRKVLRKLHNRYDKSDQG